ncbi:MAG: phosphatidate cytidylyltransferase [Candidatus Gygaella obscura]|nr:phosphatidate cytidylyltransferase [Candidatus Gygaella obscura]
MKKRLKNSQKETVDTEIFNKTMLIKRIFSSIVIIGFVVFSLFHNFLFNMLTISLIGLGLYEFFVMVEKKGIKIYKYFGIFIGLMIPVSIAFKFELTKGWEFLLIVITLISLIMLQFKRKDSTGALVGISVTMFGVLYVAWFFSFIIKIHYLDNGLNFVGALIIMTKSVDIGAYLIGMRWGKHPLIARISPKKSIEGAFGGMVFSIFASIAVSNLMGITYLHAVILGLSIGLVGQLGDLSESLLKRDCQIKDSSKIIPGIGGVLDLIDSLLFSTPVFYFYIQQFLN